METFSTRYDQEEGAVDNLRLRAREEIREERHSSGALGTDEKEITSSGRYWTSF